MVANSTVSGLPLIDIVAVGNSNGQAMVLPDNAIKIKANPIIVPNDFTIINVNRFNPAAAQPRPRIGGGG